MAIFAISFRVKDTGNRQERWQSMVDKIREIASKSWDETTSFFIIEANRTAGSLADAIYFETEMAASDTLLVVNLSTKVYAKHGEIKYPNTLDSLMSSR
ncbi:hypothetical protein [Maricaulis sp.]|uniref:hypothetical protein n=1 Tax=Maricaulis sp. TaxID=1486257 RepID=UPI003A90E717